MEGKRKWKEKWKPSLKQNAGLENDVSNQDTLYTAIQNDISTKTEVIPIVLEPDKHHWPLQISMACPKSRTHFACVCAVGVLGL